MRAMRRLDLSAVERALREVQGRFATMGRLSDTQRDQIRAHPQAAHDQLQAAGQSAEQANAVLERLIDQQAFTRAANDIFLGSAGLFLLLIGLIWLTKRPARTGGAGAADAAGAH